MILKLTCDLIWEAGGNREYDSGTFTIVWINTPHQKSSIMRTWQTWREISILLSWQNKCSVVSCKFQGVHLPDYLDEAGHGQLNTDHWSFVVLLLAWSVGRLWTFDVCFWEAVLRHMFALQGGGNGGSQIPIQNAAACWWMFHCYDVELWNEWSVMFCYILLYTRKIMFMAFL